MRMSAKWANIVGLLIISATMSGVMSAVMVGWNLRSLEGFPPAWLRSWLLGFLVSCPTSAVLVPTVVRWQQRVTGRPR